MYTLSMGFFFLIVFLNTRSTMSCQAEQNNILSVKSFRNQSGSRCINILLETLFTWILETQVSVCNRVPIVLQMQVSVCNGDSIVYSWVIQIVFCFEVSKLQENKRTVFTKHFNLSQLALQAIVIGIHYFQVPQVSSTTLSQPVMTDLISPSNT